MINISLTLQYKHLFDDSPLSIDEYLKDIPQDELNKGVLYLCGLSTLTDFKIENLFYPFLVDEDRNTEFEENLKNKVSLFRQKYSADPTVITPRSSLKLFQYIQTIEQGDNSCTNEAEIRKRLLKAYLVVNSLFNEKSKLKESKNIFEHIINTALIQTNYINTNCLNLRIAEIVKACLFLEFCEKKLPHHMEQFLHEYNISSWKEYIRYVHEIGFAAIKRDFDNPVGTVNVLSSDRYYEKKMKFFEKFCITRVEHNDADFTQIKDKPVIKSETKGKYHIIFEQFFVEKMFKSLYFVFKEINDSLKGGQFHIKSGKFRSEIGLSFSEKTLLNRIIKDSIGKKYKHLDHNSLKRKGLLDYYIRNGNKIFLFECKDNLIKKEIIESSNIYDFISELKDKFIQNSSGKPKAIIQLLNNISSIRSGNFIEDKDSSKPKNKIYPIIITHNSIFSLMGVNMLINEWFHENAEQKGISLRGVKQPTIININTLILLKGYLSCNKTDLKTLIDRYWANSKRLHDKKDPIKAIEGSISFDDFIEKTDLSSIESFELANYSDYLDMLT